MGGKRVVIRTLDIGADKQMGYFNLQKEENPALGVRAIRICLNFRTQLRALYRASAYGKTAIMFPMITSIWEVRGCRRACQKVMAELDKEGIPYNKDTGLGIMIETPASVLVAEELAAGAAHKAGIWIGICGELGADLSLLGTFLAIGIDELSISPSSVLPLRAEIRKPIAKTCTLERLEC